MKDFSFCPFKTAPQKNALLALPGPGQEASLWGQEEDNGAEQQEFTET